MDGDDDFGTEEQKAEVGEAMAATETIAPVAELEPQRSDFAVAWDSAAAEWFNAHVRNSPIAQATEAWNHLGLILPRLRDMIEAKLRG